MREKTEPGFGTNPQAQGAHKRRRRSERGLRARPLCEKEYSLRSTEEEEKEWLRSTEEEEKEEEMVEEGGGRRPPPPRKEPMQGLQAP